MRRLMARIMAFVGRDPRHGVSEWTLGRRRTDQLEAERHQFEARVEQQADRLRSYQRVRLTR